MNQDSETIALPILRYEVNPPAYHYLFHKDGEVYFWNAILGIRKAGDFFPSEKLCQDS